METLSRDTRGLSRFRSIIETAFYANNVTKVNSLEEAYYLALKSPGTIVTDHKIKVPEKSGLPKDSNVLLFNDGEVLERKGNLRRDYSDGKSSQEEYEKAVRELLFQERFRNWYHGSAYIGMHRDFMVKANILVPQGWEGLLYNWMLNFQEINDETKETYEKSLRFKDEGDIFLIAAPDVKTLNFPDGSACLTEKGMPVLLRVLIFLQNLKKEPLVWPGLLQKGMIYSFPWWTEKLYFPKG
jgi:phosphoenolpyruvate carboxykinase (ATP)